MAILTAKEIRKLETAERQKKLKELQIQLIKYRSKVNTGGQIENPGRIKEIRRTIARINTINHEDKLQAAASESS